MVLFIYANFLKTPWTRGLCWPGKRVPNWSLMTKGNWSTVPVTRWPLILLENQLNCALFGATFRTLTKDGSPLAVINQDFCWVIGFHLPWVFICPMAFILPLAFICPFRLIGNFALFSLSAFICPFSFCRTYRSSTKAFVDRLVQEKHNRFCRQTRPGAAQKLL
jgi:hypothetical protein